MAYIICNSAIDWAATGTMLQGWATLGGAAAVIFAANTGANSFKQWRVQRVEERRMVVAESILTLAYRLRRELSSARMPFQSAAETAAADRKLRDQGILNDDTPPHRATTMRVGQVTLDRFQTNKIIWESVFAQMPIAKAIFGNEVEADLQLFWSESAKVRAAAQSYAEQDEQRVFLTDEARSAALAAIGRIMELLWEGGGFDENGNETPDAMAGAIEAAMARLEGALLPSIRIASTNR